MNRSLAVQAIPISGTLTLTQSRTCNWNDLMSSEIKRNEVTSLIVRKKAKQVNIFQKMNVPIFRNWHVSHEEFFYFGASPSCRPINGNRLAKFYKRTVHSHQFSNPSSHFIMTHSLQFHHWWSFQSLFSIGNECIRLNYHCVSFNNYILPMSTNNQFHDH